MVKSLNELKLNQLAVDKPSGLTIASLRDYLKGYLLQIFEQIDSNKAESRPRSISILTRLRKLITGLVCLSSSNLQRGADPAQLAQVQRQHEFARGLHRPAAEHAAEAAI